MKARVKATGEIVEVYPSIHKGCDYDGSDGYSYVKEDIIILDDDPDYWTRLEHQYAGMAMQGILSNPELMKGYTKLAQAPITSGFLNDYILAKSVNIAHELVEKLKEKEERK